MMNNILTYTKEKSGQTGFTLIEILVALVLSMTILAGVAQIYLSGNRTYILQEAISRLQENGRFAIIFIKKELRGIGYMGCMGSTVNFRNNVDSTKYPAALVEAGNLQDNSATKGFAESAIQGFNNVTSLPSTLQDLGLEIGSEEGEMVSNTDVMLVRSALSCDGGSLVAPLMGSKSANIKISDTSCSAGCCIKQNDLLIITNCKNADLFGVVNNPISSGTIVHSSSLNLSNELSVRYGLDSKIYKFQSTLWYIGNGESGTPALFKKTIVGNSFDAVEVVEGIDDMQILFGEDTTSSGDVNNYVTADSLLNTSNVLSIKVSFLVSSVKDNVTSTPISLVYNGSSVNSGNGDRRVRRIFNTTIALRNRLK